MFGSLTWATRPKVGVAAIIAGRNSIAIKTNGALCMFLGFSMLSRISKKFFSSEIPNRNCWAMVLANKELRWQTGQGRVRDGICVVLNKSFDCAYLQQVNTSTVMIVRAAAAWLG